MHGSPPSGGFSVNTVNFKLWFGKVDYSLPPSFSAPTSHILKSSEKPDLPHGCLQESEKVHVHGKGLTCQDLTRALRRSFPCLRATYTYVHTYICLYSLSAALPLPFYYPLQSKRLTRTEEGARGRVAGPGQCSQPLHFKHRDTESRKKGSLALLAGLTCHSLSCKSSHKTGVSHRTHFTGKRARGAEHSGDPPAPKPRDGCSRAIPSEGHRAR